MTDRHLISVDELRAAGALDVPPAWRKSLSHGRVERNLFSDLPDDADEPVASDESSLVDDDEDDQDVSPHFSPRRCFEISRVGWRRWRADR